MLLYHADQDVCRWVSERLFSVPDYFTEMDRGIGIVRQGMLIAGVVYNNYRTYPNGQPHMMDMSIASIDKHWANKHTLKALFSYPFAQLRLERVQAHCSINDGGVMRFLEKLGFVQEGIHRGAYSDGSDAVSYGMLSADCGWL